MSVRDDIIWYYSIIIIIMVYRKNNRNVLGQKNVMETLGTRVIDGTVIF